VLAQEPKRFSGKVYGVVAFVVVFRLNKNIHDWGGVLDFWAWRVGSNPPFVDCGIRLIGLPALSGRDLIGACLPFPLAGRPFHRSSLAHSTLRMRHRQVQVDVSFLLRCQGSRLPLAGCNSTRGRSFLKPFIFGARKPHTNSPAQTLYCRRRQ